VLGCGIGNVGFWEGDERGRALGFNKDGSFQMSFHKNSDERESPSSARLSGPELDSPTGSDPGVNGNMGFSRLAPAVRGGS